MTLQQLRYVVEIEKTGSITKSATNLFMSQPNLSSALKELEAEIGISVFNRTAKGVEVTPDGHEFISYAKSIIAQIDRLEFIFKEQKRKTATLNVACARSSHVVNILCDYYNQLSKELSVNINLWECNSLKAMEAVADGQADVGRLGFDESKYTFYQSYARKNRIIMETLWKVDSYVLMSANHPLANHPQITMKMLEEYTRLTYSDMKSEIFPMEETDRQIAVSDRGTMMDVLSKCEDCYLWTISTHPDILKAHNLVTVPCEDSSAIIEAIIYSKNKPITKEMQWVLERLRSTQYDECFRIQETFRPDTIL